MWDMDDILLALTSSITSVGLFAYIVYLCRDWLFERLKASVKHEYDRKLESYKSQIVRREQAYEEIIDALYDMVKYFQVHKEDYGQGTGLSDEKEKEIIQRYISASSALNKAMDIGSFYISRAAVDKLSMLREREQLDYHENPRFEFYEKEYQEHKKALSELVEVARSDLGRV